MAQGATNLNSPPPEGVEAVKAKGFGLSEPFRAWFAALAEVANWTVSGALSAATATFNTLTLNTPVATPAAGQIGKGDTNWHEIGAPGEPGFQNGWTNTGGTRATAAFRKMPDGIVQLKGFVTGGTLNSVVTNLPVNNRTSKQEEAASCNLGGGTARIDSDPSGNLSIFDSNVNVSLRSSFYAEA